MNEKTMKYKRVDDYVKDLLDKKKFDKIKSLDYHGGSYTFKPEKVINARYETSSQGTMIHVEDDKMIAGFPAEEIMSIIRLKKRKKPFTDTKKIIDREGNFKNLVIHDANGKSWEFEKIISIEEDQEINEDLIIIKYWNHVMIDGSVEREEKVLYLYGSNIIGIEFKK